MEGSALAGFGLTVLYEDNHLLVVDKPAGMLSQSDTTGDLDVLTVARQLIKQREGKPGNVYLGLVHRLDRPVGGVMLLAKTSKAASRLSEQFRSRLTVKIYRAVVEGLLEPRQAELKHCLIKDRALNVTRVATEQGKGKPASLAYRVLGSDAGQSLVEIELHTGLPHQIRVQLAQTGHPIVGDRKYGGKTLLEPGRIALYAASLTFTHPVKQKQITVEAPPPRHFPWSAALIP